MQTIARRVLGEAGELLRILLERAAQAREPEQAGVESGLCQPKAQNPGLDAGHPEPVRDDHRLAHRALRSCASRSRPSRFVQEVADSIAKSSGSH